MGGNMSARGKWGEARALEFLKRAGCSLVEQGYWTRYGEIDLIVENGKYLMFVEVKLRRDARFAEAREFVSASKQGKIRKAALIWLSEHDTKLQPRFDVVEIYAPNGVKTPNPEIIHIENAFE